jgi:hypothetical protein
MTMARDIDSPTLSASYLIPLAAPMIGAEVQRRITRRQDRSPTR